jgi:DNA-directed RNA polymerase subunit RPC12/RpoP
MVECNKCGEKLTSLNVYTLEENKQSVTLIGDEDNPKLDYDTKEPVESSAVRTQCECPYCGEVLLTMEGDGEDSKIIKLLRD